MKTFRYIALLAAFVGLSSCVKTDVDIPTVNNRNTIQVVARVRPFSNRTVGTRADNDKISKEGNTECMCLAVFDSYGKCKDKKYEPNSAPTFTIEKDNLANGDQIYIFANIPNPNLDETNGATLDDFLSLVSPVSGVTEIPLLDYTHPGDGNHSDKHIQANCFPMIGSMTITDPDDIQEVIQIGLESVYAKIQVNIISKPDQKTDGIDYASFSLTGFEVHNVASEVDFNSGTESKPITYKAGGAVDSPAVEGTHDSTTVLAEVYQGVHIESDLAQSSNEASFYFYLPERFLRPDPTADEYEYPWGKGLAGLDDDERSRYPQRYKPEVAKGCAQPATFVRFFGEYIDHQGHNWNVSYDIYVGGDNYSNFDIVRNTLYKNVVTIKGISTSQDMTANSNTISIDHRVDVERVSPVIINLRRETLLDSHFEVRPLRIRLNDDFKGQALEDAKVQVEVIYEDDDPAKNTLNKRWIGLERSFGNGVTQTSSDIYLVDSELTTDRKNAAGKRKYFTTDLTTSELSEAGTFDSNGYSTAGGQKVVVPINGGECVWIYVDECVETEDDVRSAIIRVTTYDSNGEKIGEPIDYHINQRMLYPVKSGDNEYAIEFYEEYLYNYDAEDSYGQTKQEGMPWGLNGVQLSYIHDSFTCGEINSDWTTYITNNPIKYDFYIGKHDDDNDSSDVYTKDGGTLHNYAGQEFTKEIAENPNARIGALTLAQTANSAVEYCYNRNKRDADGNVVKVEWYLPSADELEDFIVPAYSTFKEFQDNYYWTSQPAYIRNAFYYEYFDGSKTNSNRVDTYVFVTYEDNKTHARATKVVYENGMYNYVLSGLNLTSENATIDCNNPICKDTYFNVMYGWYRWTESEWSWSDFQYHTEIKTEEKTFPNDEYPDDQHYNEYIDGSNKNKRYHVELEHLDDLIQTTDNGEHGYHERTKSNRVRCVRKMN